MTARRAAAQPASPHAAQRAVDLEQFGLGGRRVVFDSGLVAVDDPRITAVHEGYDDLVKVFAKPDLDS